MRSRPSSNNAGPSIRETAGSYPHVIAELNDDWRVAIAHGETAWLLQRRKEVRRDRTEWELVGRFRNRDDLIAAIRDRVSEYDDEAFEVMAELPDSIGGGA